MYRKVEMRKRVHSGDGMKPGDDAGVNDGRLRIAARGGTKKGTHSVQGASITPPTHCKSV